MSKAPSPLPQTYNAAADFQCPSLPASCLCLPPHPPPLATHRQVEDAFVATDRETGRSRGFGFVTLESEAAKQVSLVR